MGILVNRIRIGDVISDEECIGMESREEPKFGGVDGVLDVGCWMQRACL